MLYQYKSTNTDAEACDRISVFVIFSRNRYSATDVAFFLFLARKRYSVTDGARIGTFVSIGTLFVLAKQVN